MNQLNKNADNSLKNKVELSVVIPCFNEEEVLDKLIERVQNISNSTILSNNFEIILVNDGSSDETWTKILDFCRKNKNIIGIKLSRNFGHQIALTAGLELAKGNLIFILDADLQDPPELLPEMITLIEGGADVVYGQRESRNGETWFKKISAKLFYIILRKITDIDIPLDTGDFKLIKSHICQKLISMPEKQRFIRGLIAWQGFNQVPLKYERHERFAGTTKYPLSKMISFALDAITSFSISPLKLSSNLSIFSGFISVLLFIYVIISWSIYSTIPGWASIGAIITLLGAAQLLVLGIIGEYIGRIYIESKNRPIFIVEKLVNSQSNYKNE